MRLARIQICVSFPTKRREAITATTTSTKLPLSQRLAQSVLDLCYSIIVDSRQPAADTILLLKNLVRRFPYFRKARLELGRLAYEQKDYALSYAEARAVCALSSGALNRHGQLLLAKTLLATGGVEEARSLLSTLATEVPLSVPIREELAAAHMAAGDLHATRIELEKIAETDLSPSGKAALSFVRFRTQQVPPE